MPKHSAQDRAILARLGGDFKTVAELVGVENALRISKEFGGQWICIPKLDALRNETRNASIRDEYDSARKKKAVVRSLAKKHNLTMRQVYNILSQQPEEAAEIVLPLFFQTS